MLYSSSKNGFYPKEMIAYYEAAGTLPTDVVEITTDRRQELAAGEVAGKQIVAGPDGQPELSDPPPVDPQLAIDAKLAHLRTVREEILNRLGGIAGRADRKGDKATADACDVATQSLLDITKDLPADLDAIKREVVTRYENLVTKAALTAPGLVSAFAGVDL